MVHRLKTTHVGSSYRFPRYLEDQDYYYYSMESDGHEGDTEEGSGADSAPASVQGSPPASVIEISDGEPEEEQAKDLEQGGGDPDDHSDPEGSDPEEGDANDQPSKPEKWKVVVFHHDGGGVCTLPVNVEEAFPPPPPS
jgi:hypothetical protein